MSDARAFVGIAYAEADCRELARRVLASHGIAFPSDPQEAKAAGWRAVERPQPLDIAMFKTPEGLHVGVVVERGKFLHADREAGHSRVERLSDPTWAAQVEGFYRYAR